MGELILPERPNDQSANALILVQYYSVMGRPY